MTWPFENDTSAIVKKLANRSIKADKQRNIFIIVTIAFAVCLMTTLSLYSFGKSYELKTYLQGRYQAAVVSTTPDMIATLSQDENIEVVGTEVNLNTFRVDDYTLDVNYRDENDIYLRSIDLTGRLPEKENEIAISSSYLEHIGYTVALDQKINLSLRSEGQEEYTVCGIMNDDGSNRIYQVLVSDIFMKSYYTTQIPYVGILRIAGSNNFQAAEVKIIIQSCLADYGIGAEQIAFSSSYFESIDNSSRDVIVVVAISLLIVIACSMVIYSLFYISVVGKIKEYGRLRVIGMTQKQTKRMVKKEAARLSLLSIPAGVVLGCALGYVLIPKGWYWPNSIMCTLGAVVLTEITVVLSVRKPIKIASSVSPIEALRITSTTDNSKVVETSKLSRKLSPAALAKLNFLRNRKKVVMTLFSLGFTGILLMCGATYLCSVNAENIARQMFGDKELAISLSPNTVDTRETSEVTAMETLQKSNPLTDSLINELLQNSQITEVETIKGCYANVFLPDNSNINSSPSYNIIGLSEKEYDAYRQYFLSDFIDYDTLVSEHGILVDDTSNTLRDFDGYDVKLGDQIDIKTDKGEKITFVVAGIINLQNTKLVGYNFFIPEAMLNELKTDVTNFNTQILIRTDLQNLSTVESFVFDKLGSNQDLSIDSFSDVVSFAKQSLKSYQTPIYDLVIFIALFGIINLINTLMTNLVSRQQEFGVLQSIGLSSKQLSKMLQTECFYYVLGTMIVTLTVGTLAGYIMCFVFDQVGVFGTLHYTFPVLQILVFFAVLMVIAAFYSILAIRYCRKQPLVERIKSMD